MKAGLRRLLWPTVLLVLVLIVSVVSVLLYESRTRAVLFRYHDRAVPEMEPGLVVFNPFRDRAPEQAATAFLERLKNRQCDGLGVELFGSPDERERICHSEEELPIRAWTLKNRTRKGDTETLCFEVDRANYGPYSGLVWLKMQNPNGAWTVTGFSAVY